MDTFSVAVPALSSLVTLVQHINHTMLLYLIAAAVERFRPRHMWITYLALALAAATGSHG
jgi:hypothetical protein